MSEFTITRKLDELGRIVLPIDIRRALSLEPGDSVDITIMESEDAVRLSKKRPSCSSCRGKDQLKRLPNGIYLCTSCIKTLS